MPIDVTIRRNFQKGLQHECALMHAWVWKDKIGLITFYVIIHENIQIECSGRVRIFTYSAMAALDFK